MRKPKMLKGIKIFKDGKDVIAVCKDKTCDMIMIKVNNECVTERNSWDFHNGCYGEYEIPEYNHYKELVVILKEYLKTNIVKYEEYNYY